MKNTYWGKEEVLSYDANQKSGVEQKEVAVSNIVRIISYFYKNNNLTECNILDIGCGNGIIAYKLLPIIPECNIIGIDMTQEMLNLSKISNQQYKTYLADFNNKNFWIPEIDRKFDFIVSSMTLHYVNDIRLNELFSEIYDHLTDKGIFIGLIANKSADKDIAEMEKIFKIEYAYKNTKPQDNVTISFGEFKSRQLSRQKKMGINWRPPETYLKTLKKAGFPQADIVWHLWVKSIYLAIK